MKRALLTMLLLGPAARAEADPSEAIARRMRDLEKRLADAPGDGRAWLELGLVLERVDDPMRAQQYLARAWELQADPARALPALVRISLALEDYRAAAHYGEALEATLQRTCARPRDGAEPSKPCHRLAETRVLLAELQEAMGDWAVARDLLEAAIRADAKQADAYSALSRLHLARVGGRAAARATLERGIAQLGTDPRAEPLQVALAQLFATEAQP